MKKGQIIIITGLLLISISACNNASKKEEGTVQKEQFVDVNKINLEKFISGDRKKRKSL